MVWEIGRIVAAGEQVNQFTKPAPRETPSIVCSECFIATVL